MSSRDISRRTEVEVRVGGVDISERIRPYLTALIYTDNEEGEADDLQLRLQDREEEWLERVVGELVAAAVERGGGVGTCRVTAKSGLNVRAEPETGAEKLGALPYGTAVTVTEISGGWAAIDYRGRTAWVSRAWLSGSAEAGQSGGAGSYQVTARSGLNVRAEPGTGAAKLGALPYGAVVTVSGISGGWAETDYRGRAGYLYAGYLKPVDAAAGTVGAGTVTGASIEAVIVRRNWRGDGKDDVLPCGQFELDSVDWSGPPSEGVLRATSLPFQAPIRQTQRSKGWEHYHLSGIAREMAEESGMVLMFLCGNDPFYERVEQYRMSDIALLSRLCRDAGIALKASAGMLVLFDQREREETQCVRTIRKGDGGWESYQLSVGTADVQYQSCRVSYNDPGTGKRIEGVAKVEDYQDSEKDQQLEIAAQVGSIAEAKALAEKKLREHNKYHRTARFTVPGDPELVAGATVELSGWGLWDGKYIVRRAVHRVDKSGYTTEAELRQVLEGY